MSCQIVFVVIALDILLMLIIIVKQYNFRKIEISEGGSANENGGEREKDRYDFPTIF